MNNYWFINRGMQIISPENIYNDVYLEDLEKRHGLDRFNIYLICKTPLVKFDKKLVEIHDNVVYFHIYHDGENHTGEYEINNIKDFKKNYTLNEKSSNDSTLIFQHKELKNENFIMNINMLDKFFGIEPEILYIGKSQKMSKRLTLHEKYLKILAENPNNSKIRIYLISFGTGYGSNNLKSRPSHVVANLAFNRNDKVLYEENYLILESILINYFKPKYNDQYVNSDLRKNKRIQRLLIKNGIENIFFSNLRHPQIPHLSTQESKKNGNENCFGYSTQSGTFIKGFNITPLSK